MFHVWRVFSKFSTIQSFSVLTSHSMGDMQHIWTKQKITARPHKLFKIELQIWPRLYFFFFNQCCVRQMHMTRLRMAKRQICTWLLTKKGNEDVLCPSLLWHSPFKSGAAAIVWHVVFLHLLFFCVTSARNSKRPSGCKKWGSPLTDIVCSLQRKGRACRWGRVLLQTVVQLGTAKRQT